MIELLKPNVYRVDNRTTYVLAAGTYDPDDPQSVADALTALQAAADNPAPPTLSDLKRDAIESAQREQQRRLGFGVRVTVGPAEFVLSSDQAQRERIAVIAAALANGKTYALAGVRLYRRDGEELSAATVAHFRAVVGALEDRLGALAEHYGDLVQLIRAAADASELAAVDVTAGWPAV